MNYYLCKIWGIHLESPSLPILTLQFFLNDSKSKVVQVNELLNGRKDQVGAVVL